MVSTSSEKSIEGQSLQNMIERLSHHDKDERYMAISDIKSAIEDYHELDVGLQSIIRIDIVKRLDDSSSDVQAMAVKCLASIVEKFDDSEVLEIVRVLGNLSMTGVETLRDMYAQGLKTALSRMPIEYGERVCDILIPRLLHTLQTCTTTTTSSSSSNDDDDSAQHLMLIRVMLERFNGVYLQRITPTILRVLMSLLHVISLDSRKLLSSVLGVFSVNASLNEFNVLVKHVLMLCEKSLHENNAVTLSTDIDTMTHICRKSAQRIKPYLNGIIPLLECVCNVDVQTTAADAEHSAVELRHNALIALQSLIESCGLSISCYFDRILHIAFRMIVFDPLIIERHNEMNDDVESVEEEVVDDWGLDPDSQYEADAGDTSWKLRSSAVLIIRCLLSSRFFCLKNYFTNLLNLFILRFTEREINVQIEVFNTFAMMVEVCSRRHSNNTYDKVKREIYPSCIESIESSIKNILEALEQPLSSSVIRTQQGAFTVLLSLSSHFMSSVLPLYTRIEEVLLINITSTDASLQALAVQTLQRFVTALCAHSGKQHHISNAAKRMMMAIVSISNDKNAFVSTRVNALNAVSMLPHVLKPRARSFRAFLNESVSVLIRVVNTQCPLTPVTVRRQALRAVTVFFVCCGDVLCVQLREFATILHYALTQHPLRSSALTSIVDILSSPCANVLQTCIVPLFDTVLSVLDTTTVSAKVQCEVLHALTAIEEHKELSEQCYNTDVVREKQQQTLNRLLPLISPQQMYVLPSALALFAQLLTSSHVSVNNQLLLNVRQRLFVLMRCAGLSANTLVSISQLFLVILVRYNHDDDDDDDKNDMDDDDKKNDDGGGVDGEERLFIKLLMSLKSLVNDSNDETPEPHILFNVAACVSSIILAVPSTATMLNSIDMFLASVKNESVSQKHISLLIIGSIGVQRDLSDVNNIFDTLVSVVYEHCEPLTFASSCALGAITSGNLLFFVPLIIQRLNNAHNNVIEQYLLLSAFKELLSHLTHKQSSTKSHKKFSSQLCMIALSFADSTDEGIRGVISALLGKLVLLSSEDVSTTLYDLLYAANASTRATVITAFKFAFHHADELPKSVIRLPRFLACLHDADINARRQCFLALNSLLNTSCSTLVFEPSSTDFNGVETSLLHTIVLPHVFEEIRIRVELIREVDFGQFKEIVDDGLLLRRAAFQTLFIIVTMASFTVLDSVVSQLVQHVVVGAQDRDCDVQLAVYSIMESLGNHYSVIGINTSALIHILNVVPEHLTVAIKKQLKAAKQEGEKGDGVRKEVGGVKARDVLVGFVRALLALHCVPGSDDQTMFHAFYLQVLKTAALADIIEVEQRRYDVSPS